MSTPEPSLAERIATAEQAGDWREAGRLKAAMLLERSARTDHNGRYRPEPEAVPAAVAEPTAQGAEPSPGQTYPGRPREALRPAAMPTAPVDPGPGIVGMLNAPQPPAQDAPAAAAGTPVEQLHAPGQLLAPPEPTIPQQIAAAEKAGDWGRAGRLKAAQLHQIHDEMNGLA
ncbi:hypothetical protein [Streptomyces sp. S.PB5]|uniref:hypothetical protein n=1 Tax=Streptomyces sp. S.PB5 TaxID=3020844 RepID=UPI0025B2220F|nr:hypothetical protein [Streptomyces sp. S.PB5]MDN3023819.1 hypothetical protein [Streptomyces sp. S.PB5]